MDMRKYVGANFVTVDDVRDGPLQVQIAVVKEGKYNKANLVFETGETLGLNATNSKILVKAYGPDSDDWIGKEIKLVLGRVPYQGDEIESVIVEPISSPVAAADKAVAAEKLGDFNDEIPY